MQYHDIIKIRTEFNDHLKSEGDAVHSEVERELRKIKRLRDIASFSSGITVGTLITYIILKLL